MKLIQIVLLIFTNISIYGCSGCFEESSRLDVKSGTTGEFHKNNTDWFAISVFQGSIKIPSRYIIVSKAENGLTLSSPGGLLKHDLVEPFGLIRILNHKNIEQRLDALRKESEKILGAPEASKICKISGINVLIDVVDVRGHKVPIVYLYDQSQIIFISDDDENLWKNILIGYSKSFEDTVSIDEIGKLCDPE